VHCQECVGKIMCQRRSRAEAPGLFRRISGNEGKRPTTFYAVLPEPFAQFFWRPACQDQDPGPLHEVTRPPELQLIASVFARLDLFRTLGRAIFSKRVWQKRLMGCHCPCRCSTPAKYLSGVGRFVIIFCATALPKTITTMT